MRTREQSNAQAFRSILCAIDFSLPSYAALEKAVEIVRRRGGHLTALFVEDPVIGLGAAASGYDASLLRKSTLAQLTRLMERVATPRGLEREAWSVETLVGKPARTIIAFARRISADLIVMGTNGRTGPAKLFFGSVADEVLRRAPAPLLIVARSRARTAAKSPRHRPVIVGGIELGEHDRADARRMSHVAELIGGRLTLVHVVYRTGTPPFVAAPDAGAERELAAARKRLENIAKSVRAKSRVLVGRPEDEIIAASSDARADFIVLALRRGRGIFGPRQGATTYRILCTSTTPVLALPSS